MGNYKTLWAILVLNLMFLFMIAAALWVHHGDGAALSMTVMVGVFGVLCGWLTGTLSSPSSNREEARFTKYAGLISGFISGYLVSKIDPFVTNLVTRLTGDPIFGFRIMVFLSCFICGVLIMYFYRAYLVERGHDPQPAVS